MVEKERSFIRGYNVGANISLLNVIYHKPIKVETKNGGTTYTDDSIDIIFKDLDTGEKKFHNIVAPDYTFYMTNEGIPVDYPLLFIDKNNVHPITCEYRKRTKTIAEATNNLDFFYDNNRNGNYKANDALYSIPSIFNADMNIEDYYRWKFDRTYKNEQMPKVTKMYFDIETDNSEINGDFPEMGQCTVNAITLVDDINKRVYTLLLENYNNPLIEEFKKIPNVESELKSFVQTSVGGWKEEHRFGLHEFKYKIMFYDEEINMIADAFNVINIIKPDFAMAWNIAFDLPYLIARILKLGYDPVSIICHKDFINTGSAECSYYIDNRAQKFEERGDYAQISSYTTYIDQLILFASRRKGQRAVDSYKLDYVGEKIAGVRKLDYSHITTRIDRLPYLDYKTFVFYNVMDTIVQYCIESKTSDVDFIYARALQNNTRYSKAFRQTVYLINRAIKSFWDDGYVIGNNNNKSNPKASFAGAYVAPPELLSDAPKMKINGIPVNILNRCGDFDYSSLYPSIINQNNVAPNTQHGKIILPEAFSEMENIYNNEYYNREVWFAELYTSKDSLSFCQRYLKLGSYQDVYHDIIEYFSTVKAPGRGLRIYDPITGMRTMCTIVPNKEKRNMVRIVDNTEPRIMVRYARKMPNEYKNYRADISK